MAQQVAGVATAPRVLAPEAPSRTGSVLLVASGAAFLAFLDATVANLAVADLRGEFAGVSVADASWVVTLYAVAFAALLAPAGRVADAIGRRTLLIAGVGAFTGFSLACAVAPSLGLLLAARALQGAAAAMMIPASLAIVLRDAPPERRAAAIGAWSAAGAMAAAAGPAVGGVLVDTLGWRSVFLVSVPVGLAILAGARQLPRGEAGGGPLPDLAGTVLLGAGIGLAAFGIGEGAAWGWADGRTLACLVGAAAAAGLALRRSFHHPAPAIETALWRGRTFRRANLASLLYGAALFPWLLVGVLVLVGAWGYSELEAGLAMTPGAVSAAIVALRAGPLVARYGARWVVAAGAFTMAGVGLWLALAISTEPRFLTLWLPGGVLLGMGMGAVSTGLSAAAALSVPPARFAAGTGLNQTARQVGGALGVAVLATMLAGGGADVGAYTDVYLFCTVASVAAGVVALGLVHEEAGA
jgi:EmrB/QacA subfamily drug resistance transporter